VSYEDAYLKNFQHEHVKDLDAIIDNLVASGTACQQKAMLGSIT
jgi:hypothetical protein